MRIRYICDICKEGFDRRIICTGCGSKHIAKVKDISTKTLEHKIIFGVRFTEMKEILIERELALKKKRNSGILAQIKSAILRLTARTNPGKADY